MSRTLWIAGLGTVLLGAAALALVYTLTEPLPGPASPPPVAVRPPSRTPIPVATPGGANPEQPSPVLGPPATPVVEQPPGSVAVFATPDDRAEALGEMQRRRMQKGMDDLNERAARRAAAARR